MSQIDITATGKTVAEALENAKSQLGIEELDGYDFKVIEEPKKGGLFGLKTLPAKVRVFSVEEENPEVKENKENREEKTGNKFSREFFSPKKAETPETELEKNDRSAKPQKQNEKQQNRRDRQKQKAAKETPDAAQIVTPPELENDAALNFVRLMLKDLELDAKAEMYIDDEEIRRIIVCGTDACSLIGYHGETLDAFQYLANLADSRARKHGDGEDKGRITVDIENYRAKREATLRALARRMANKALKYRRSVMLEPMNAYERRIIHSEIQNIEGVSTNSVGTDTNRKVVIYLTQSKEKKSTEVINEDVTL